MASRTSLLGAACLLLFACPTVKEGPAGPQGPKGADGVDGTSVTVSAVSVGSTDCPTGGQMLSSKSGFSFVCNGAADPQAPAGPKGDKGDKGDQGVPGPQGVPGAADDGCPGARIRGACVLRWDNTQATNFQAAAQLCANAGGDLCTDSQAWPLTRGDEYEPGHILNGAHWTASFADNDHGYWTSSNGGTGDDHIANASYGYACCGGWTPSSPLVPVRTVAQVKVVAVHNIADTYWAGAAGYCAALKADLCTDSQTYLLRQAGELTVPTWTNSHSDNDTGAYNAINGGVTDDTHPAYRYGFACCASLRPAGGGCPVAKTQNVCVTTVHNAADTTFGDAATACAAAGGDLCSTAQESILRTFNLLTVPSWSNSHSDNDGLNASVAVGAMADDPSLSTQAGYACCLN